MRGDIVQRGWAIGICRGDQAEFFGGDFTLMKDVDLAWAIGPGNQNVAKPILTKRRG